MNTAKSQKPPRPTQMPLPPQVNSRTTTYRYNNGMLLSEQTGDETLRYYYDATRKVTSITYKKGSNAEVSYFYARNLPGDIIAIYRSRDSALIGTYEYDL